MKYVLPLLLLVFALPLLAQKDRKSRDEQSQQQALQQAMAAMFANKDCKMADSYAFDHQFTSIYRSWDAKGKEDNWIKSRNLLSDKTGVLGITILESSMADMPSSTMVIDADNQVMVTLMEQQGMKMALCMPMDGLMDDPSSDRAGDKEEMSELKKSGKTKVFLGHTCEEWVSEDKNMTYSMWITEKSELPMSRYYEALNKQGNNQLGIGVKKMPQGMLLFMEGTSRKSKEKVQMEVLEIQPRRGSTLSTEGYQRF
jgi:hypothetical protein